MNSYWFLWTFFFGTFAMAQAPPSFETAVDCIKRFEGEHTRQKYPYIGYGHKIRSGEEISSPLTERQADSLLRADLRQKCSVFRHFGVDSLLLGVLAYNVGEYTLLGYGQHHKSLLIRKLEAGDRNIRQEYLSFRLYRGSPVKSLEGRRKSEFELLFVMPNRKINETKLIYKNSSFRGIIPDEAGRTYRSPCFGGRRPCFIGTSQ